MKFAIEIWDVKTLLELLENGKLNLNPPYQRNPLWTKVTQKHLIQSIKDGAPIPNLFLFKNSTDSFEMVDGQQRTRALKLYKSTNEIDLTKDDIQFKQNEFLNYKIPVTIITEIGKDEHIDEFYYMVNSSGIKLNRPETFKAQYFHTTFLKLVEELTADESFQKLNIIPSTSQKRMMDRDLVEELSALILHGITDKKNQVDKLYENDITEQELEICKSKFKEVIKHFLRFDAIQPIKGTRYRQRNDFYTLFGFLKDNLNIETEILDYFYLLLLQFERGIRPSKFSSKTLAEYAFNCVSQSNSSKARQTRLEILNKLLLNPTNIVTPEQKEIIEFYQYEPAILIEKGKYFTFDANILKYCIDKKQIDE